MSPRSDPAGDYRLLPPSHRNVIDECIAEAWRNIENGDPEAQTGADAAADIAQRLVDVFGVITYPSDREVVNPRE